MLILKVDCSFEESYLHSGSLAIDADLPVGWVVGKQKPNEGHEQYKESQSSQISDVLLSSLNGEQWLCAILNLCLSVARFLTEFVQLPNLLVNNFHLLLHR